MHLNILEMEVNKMLFIYIFAGLFSALIAFGGFVLMTIENFWTMEHGLLIFLTLGITGMAIYGAYAFAKLANSELAYWDFFR